MSVINRQGVGRRDAGALAVIHGARDADENKPATLGTNSPVARTQPPTGETEPLNEKSLFADAELSGLRSRWDEVQSGFVDDPRQCVQKADALVSDVVDQLTTGFSEVRSRLEAQWARGEEPPPRISVLP